MIYYTKGNLFESQADCLINTVNCEGFMGKGIAYQFKMKFPENNKAYVKACKSGELRIGTIHVFKENGVTIVNFPTKDKWREDSKLEYIKVGMCALVKALPTLRVKRIAIPPLGCGNGGLLWNDVKEIIEEYLKDLSDYDFLVYEPATHSYKVTPSKPPKLSFSALVLLDIRLHLEKFNSLRLQKASYFLNFFLDKEYFKFDKWKYGPYAHSIDIVARSIREYQDYYKLENSKVTFDHLYKVICSKKIDKQLTEFHPMVLKSTQYINQIEKDKDLEGIATVLFLIQTKGVKTNEEILKAFKNWSEDKAKRFSDQEILKCIKYLQDTSIIFFNLCGEYEL